MLTDIGPTAGSQFYGTQIPAMGMNIANISSHIPKPGAGMTMVVSVFTSIFFFKTCRVEHDIDKHDSPERICNRIISLSLWLIERGQWVGG